MGRSRPESSLESFVAICMSSDGDGIEPLDPFVPTGPVSCVVAWEIRAVQTVNFAKEIEIRRATGRAGSDVETGYCPIRVATFCPAVAVRCAMEICGFGDRPARTGFALRVYPGGRLEGGDQAGDRRARWVTRVRLRQRARAP